MCFLILFVSVISTKVHPWDQPTGREGDEKERGKEMFQGEKGRLDAQVKEVDSQLQRIHNDE